MTKQRQSRMNTSVCLARKAIRTVYNRKIYSEQEDAARCFQRYLGNNGSARISQVFRYSWLKQTRRMITYRLTSTLLQTLPLQWQKMAEMHYGPSEKQQAKVSMDLFISSSTFNNWDLKMLQMVINYAILLRLSTDDVFYSARLVNMVKALSDLLLVIKKLDPDGKDALISPAFVSNVSQKLVNYRQIITIIENYKLNSRNGTLPLVVSAMCSNPEATAQEIALAGPMDPTTVSNNLRLFRKEISHYLI